MSVAPALSPARARVLSAASFVWQGRLSWMRMILAVLFGIRTYHLVQSWHIDVPDYGYQGWVFAVVPPPVRDFLLSHPNAVTLGVIVLVALVVVGLATRPALLALVGIGLFARAVEVSQGVFDHESSLTTQILVILAFAPGTNAISLEHVLRWRRRRSGTLREFLTAPFRQWGVFLIIGVLALTYTASGLSKLRFGGLSWLDGETLGFYLRGLTAGDTVYLVGGGPATWRDDFGLQMYTYGNYNFGNYHPGFLAGIVDAMAHSPAIMSALSVATVLLEISGLLLFVPRLRSLLLVGYIGMHATIGLLMGLPFVEYQVICLLLIEWERIVPFLLRHLHRRRETEPAPAPLVESPVAHG
jgi:uncharacterized membrane protein YphA (DoxX/SURF4 family)